MTKVFEDYIWGVKPLDRNTGEIFFLSGFNHEYGLARIVNKKMMIFENLILRDEVCRNYRVADSRMITQRQSYK